MIVYYFGADSPWIDQDAYTIRRRNMAILLAIANHEATIKVYNIVRTTRFKLLRETEKVLSNHPKIENLYIAPILPERGLLGRSTRSINRFALKYLHRKAFKKNDSSTRLAWCYWPQGFLDYEFLNLQYDMVFDTDHNIIVDPNLEEENKAYRKKLLLQAAARSKYVVSSSRSMLKWYEDHHVKNTKLMLNGVFEKRINLNSVTNSSLNYQVTYCGTFSKWIKFKWLIRIIEDHPLWTFNFIGQNYKTDIEMQLQSFKNVKMYGFLEPKDVEVIIQKSNVCIGLYEKANAFDVNSMKLYDYLSKGVPVVVNNYHPNLKEDFNNLLNIATTYEEFKNLIENPRTNNPDKLKEFLTEANWLKRIIPILDEFTT